MVEPFANERKNIRFAQPRANLRGTFSVSIVHWQMVQPFTVQNLNFELKLGYGFCLPDSLKSQPLVITNAEKKRILTDTCIAISCENCIILLPLISTESSHHIADTHIYNLKKLRSPLFGSHLPNMAPNTSSHQGPSHH